MQILRLLALAAIALSIADNVLAQHRCRECRCDEPFLKFIDDLCCFPQRKCSRDPYEERIETERHDFTQSTKTVGGGVLQVESGYLFLYKDTGEEIEKTHTTPELLLRWGWSDDIEFRLRWNYVWQFIDVEENLDAALDMVLSTKLGVTENERLIPESALEIRMSVPTGGETYTLGRVEVGFDYIYAWEVAEGWELYGSTGYLPSGLDDISLNVEDLQNDDFEVWSQSVAIGTELTERITMYNEWFALWSYAAEDNFNVSAYNIGVDYYVTNDFVVDIRFGLGLTKDSDDFFSGIGGGYRF